MQWIKKFAKILSFIIDYYMSKSNPMIEKKICINLLRL